MRGLEMKTETLRYRKSEISAFYDINKRHKMGAAGNRTRATHLRVPHVTTEPCPRCYLDLLDVCF